jgi:LPPG:FO 2-phospho-L-lactate transferase
MIDALYENFKVVALAGGVGGSKMVNGLAQILSPENLFVIVNTGDDFEHLGLHISPDLDTVMYTLAGVNNPATGWGRAGESWHTMGEVKQLDGPAWFNLGDKDLANNLLRTHWLRQGQRLSQVTAQLCQRFGVRQTVMPMTDSSVCTIVHTDEGKLAFQDYFVRRDCQPKLRRLVFEGADTADINPAIETVIRAAHLIVITPSNPLLSIDPILSLPGMTDLIRTVPIPKIAVSPIIGGQAVKGPAAKIMQELGMDVSPVGVALHLKHILTGFIFDTTDQNLQSRIEGLGLKVMYTNTLMRSRQDQARLACEVVEFGLGQL